MVAAEVIIDSDDVIALFKTKIGEVHRYFLLDVTDDCPHTAEVVWVSLRIVGRCQAVMTAEINVASAGTFGEGDRRAVGEGRG